MKADRLTARGIKDPLGNDYCHKRHYCEIGVERFELFVGRVGAERGRLAKWKPKFKGLGFERVSAIPGGVWRSEHVDDLIAACLDGFECFGRECRLAN